MLLEIKDLAKSFGSREEGTHQQVIRDLSLTMNDGEAIAVVGPSGSGKSTLLHIIGGMEPLEGGSVSFKDRDLASYSEQELNHFRNQEIGFVFQFHHLLPQCNALENVLVPALLNPADIKEKTAYAESLLERVGMVDHRYKLPGQLSGGECQRVAMVRAMINKPSLLLADEPTGALDRENAKNLMEMLVQFNATEDLAMVVVTHAEDLAGEMGSVYRLDQGKLLKK